MAASTSVFTGPPTSGFYTVGDTITDANNIVWQCVATGFAGINASGTAQFDVVNVVATVGVGAANGSTVSAAETGVGVVHRTVLTLTDTPQALPNADQFIGTKIYDFPAGRILILGVLATIAQKTTSILADTLNASKTGALSLGTATASSTTLNSTMADLMPSTAFTSSATINVAGTAVSGALASSAQFDGTSTAVDMFINTAYVTDGDVDADATQTLTGTVQITWINLGDY